MKLITLNTWGGRVTEQLYDFIKKNSSKIDIFCFQEMYHGSAKVLVEEKGDVLNLFSNIQNILSEHTGYFRPSLPGYGLAVFVNKNIKVIEEGDVIIYINKEYKGGGNHLRNLQYIKFTEDNKLFSIANIHGLWNGMGKTDTEDRLYQSKKILDFTKNLSHDFILCGDFNLLPDTESIKMIEDSGLRNLIKEFSITSTRTSLYEKPVKFADYIFSSKGIKVKDFKVLPDEVSDHSPLYLEFE